MKKRDIGILLGIICVGTVGAAGCGTQKTAVLDPEDPVTIDIWTYYNSAAKESFDQMVDEFNTTIGEKKGIIVNASTSGGVNELVEQVDAELKKDEDEINLPEIVGCYMDTAYEIYAQEGLADLRDYFSEEELSEYVDSYLQEGYIDDQLVLLPVAKSTEILALNTTDWEEFARECNISEDVFQTWEQIADTAKRYYAWTDAQTEAPYDGKALFGRDSLSNYVIVGSSQLGSPIFTIKDGNVTINLDRDVMKKLWDNYYVPSISGYYGSYGRFRSDDMQTGKLIASVGSSTSAAFLPSEVTRDDESTYPVQIKIFEVPHFEGTEDEAVQQGAGMTITKSDEKHEYAAAVFMKWFTEKEQNVKFSSVSSYLPVKKEANDYAYIESQMEQNKIDASELIRETLEVAVDQANIYKLTVSKPFTGSTDARYVIEDLIEDTVTEDRNRVVELLDEGTTLEDAVAQVNTEEHFEEWLQKLDMELNKIM